MRLLIPLFVFIAPLSAVEYQYRDANAMAALDGTARQMGVELYVDPALAESVVGLRLSLQGKAMTYDELLSGVCVEIGRLVTIRESIALDPGDQVVVTCEIIENAGKRVLLARREVKKAK
jgi:hypothetical protein